MTAPMPPLVCRRCGEPVTYGQLLPFAHTTTRPVGVAPHYAMAVRPITPRGPESPPAPALSGSPEDAIPTHRASATG